MLRLILALLLTCATRPCGAATYYVRQTVGDDAHDGLSAETAWRHVAKLSSAMHAGDTAYVGPGLYREEVTVLNDGRPDGRLIFIADVTGQHTGDPPGTVMITGADPVDENIFVAQSAPGVYTAPFPYRVVGVVEMDGLQDRYMRADQTEEHVVGKLPEIETVAKHPSSYFYDPDVHTLSIHTNDGRPPTTHAIE